MGLSTRGWARAEPGQSVLETALTLPVLLLILLGIVDGARLLLAGVVLQTAVLAGAQYGALSPQSAADQAGIDAAVRNEIRFPQVGPDNPTVTAASSTDSNGELRITVTGTFTVTTLFTYPGLPQSFTFSRTTIMQVRR